MKRLVVTADDFGLAPEVNEAVEEAHRRGILSAASLMVSGPAAAQAVAVARRNPDLRVGLHLVLVEGAPTLAPAQVPRLAPDGSRFRDGMASGAVLLAVSAAARRELAAEIEAQFLRFKAFGLRLDHVNSHKHFAVHPLIGARVVEACLRHGVAGLRAPVERAAMIDAPSAPRGLARRFARRFDLAGLFARRLAGQAQRRGLRPSDQVVGLAWTGAMTAERLIQALDRLPDGFTEIYAHPATADSFAGSAPGYRYRAELEALIAPEVAAALRRSRAALGGYADVSR